MKGLAKLRYIWFLFKPVWKHGKAYMIVTLFTSAILIPLSQVASTLLPKSAIDAVMQHKTVAQTLTVIALFTAVIALVNITNSFIQQVFLSVTQTKVYYKILQEVNERALRTDFKYYDNPEFYTMFTYAQQNYAVQAQGVANMIPQLLQNIVTAAAMGVIVTQAGPILLIVTFVFVILQLSLQLPQIRLSADFNVKMTDLSRPINYVYRVMQQKENTAEMRSSGAGQKLLKSFITSLNKYVTHYFIYVKKTLKYVIPQGLLSPLQSALILAYVVIFVINGDPNKIGLYASLTAAAGTLSGSIQGLFNTVSNVFQSTLYGERIARFFETESVIEPPRAGAVPPPDGKYAVELRDISFKYDNAAFGIEHFSLDIKPGQRVAIVGENGAGKSTLTKLLVRLYDVDDGVVLINGRDIREFDVHALRRRIGIAYQDVRILAMSLRDNLTAYNDASDEELRAVMEKLGLSGVLEKVSGNFGTMVSREFTEDGAVLSGGEAQRLSLARLFTGDFGLLLLDEPSSALDPLAEYKLMQLILDKSNTATTIMIAHRLSTVRQFDIIYHVEDGAIIETGTHDELIAAKGKYYEMFTRQAENYQSELLEPALQI